MTDHSLLCRSACENPDNIAVHHMAPSACLTQCTCRVSQARSPQRLQRPERLILLLLLLGRSWQHRPQECNQPLPRQSDHCHHHLCAAVVTCQSHKESDRAPASWAIYYSRLQLHSSLLRPPPQRVAVWAAMTAQHALSLMGNSNMTRLMRRSMAWAPNESLATKQALCMVS